MEHQVRDPDFAARVRDSFSRQRFMGTLGAELTSVGPGTAEIEVGHREDLCQQHGFFHGGLVGTIADNACGYAAYSLMAASDSVLTVEYKVNLVAPASGDRLISRARVVRAGRRISVCHADVFVWRDGQEHLCATALGTFMRLENTSDHSEDTRAA